MVSVEAWKIGLSGNSDVDLCVEMFLIKTSGQTYIRQFYSLGLFMVNY